MIAALVAYAAYEFELNETQEGDGKTLKEHLVSAWRQTGIMPQALADAPPLPDGAAGIWRDFLDIHQDREIRDGQPCRLAARDIEGWQLLNRARLEPWEVDAVRRLDRAYLIQRAKEKAK